MPIRIPCLLLVLALAAPLVHAEEKPTAETGTRKAKTRAWTPVDLPGTPVTVAAGDGPTALYFGSDQGQLYRYAGAKGVTWRASLGKDPADRIVAGSRGDVVVASTATELIALSKRDGSLLWRAKRPITFDLSADGRTLFTISKRGDITELDAATGTERATRKAADRREVALASLHPGSGLAVLGVADG